ncbi:tyrosine-protein phosphatase [Arthrobacter sp. ATA002]|uniref:tyrosine-protein phosphatase n=1 Tax=Arthrobacter sp. ATA002 TaxID=2991715 RepID=UPI002E36868C|nr:tyrosine-protein phosphatase [Arthrobacter sp. ATA002]
MAALVTGAPEEAIGRALEWVDEHHGGAAGYLLSGGLLEDELAMLRRRLRRQP